MRLMKVLTFIVFLFLALALVAYFVMRGSLPKLTGELSLSGLDNQVIIERDASGWPTLKVFERSDAAQALGYLHAQERFFQMDLLRRFSAGELSALVGVKTLDRDKRTRQHQFRKRAELIIAQLSKTERKLLERYADGVNQGMADLRIKPLEYLILNQEPKPWLMEDSILVVFSMYLRLQGLNKHEIQVGFLRDVLSPELFDFLVPKRSFWDAPLMPEAPLVNVDIPAPPVINQDASDKNSGRSARNWQYRMDNVYGSNGWAVGKDKSILHSAILANDMHLSLTIPNTWYLATIEQTDPKHKVSGVTLPGTPLVVVGMTNHLAWGFTNSYGDWHDWVIVELDEKGQRYQAKTGWQDLKVEQELIEIAGRDAITIEVKKTRWGPIMKQDHEGRPLAYRWVAHDIQAVSLGLMKLENAKSVAQALKVLDANVGIPAQNIMLADSGGRIAWTVAGPIPKRYGFNGRWPISWHDAKVGWQGYLSANEYPSVYNPKEAFLFTANNRVAAGEALRKMGWGNYAMGARATQIKQRLMEQDKHSPESFGAIQLDTENRFLKPWFDLVVNTLQTQELNPRQQQALSLIQSDSRKEELGGIGLLIIDKFRKQVIETLMTTWLSSLQEQYPDFDYLAATRLIDAPIWQIVSQRAHRWLPTGFQDWQTFLLSMFENTIAIVDDYDPLQDIGKDQYRVSIEHPIFNAIPGLRALANPKETYLPGAQLVPRVQGQRFGASIRFIFVPGDFNRSLYSMPAGQSGHLLSPYYLEGHGLWEQGKYDTIGQNKVKYQLTLQPK